MKKRDITKLALMGLASGLLVSGQAAAEATAQQGVQVARGGCGAGKCGAQKSSSTNGTKGQIADNSDETTPTTGTPKSCSGKKSCSGQTTTPTPTTTQPQGSSMTPKGEGSVATSDTTKPVNRTQTTTPLTETDFVSQLNSQGKAEYQRLSPEGKALALKLANQGSFYDKNQAVKAAVQKMAEKKQSPQGH